MTSLIPPTLEPLVDQALRTHTQMSWDAIAEIKRLTLESGNVWKVVTLLLRHHAFDVLETWVKEVPSLVNLTQPGQSLLMDMVQTQNEVAFAWLVDQGADLSYSTLNGRTIWWTLSGMEANVALPMAKLLLEKGEEELLFQQDEQFDDILDYLCKTHQGTLTPQKRLLFETLVSYLGCERMAPGRDEATLGDYLFHEAAFHHQLELVQVLLNHGASLQRPGQSWAARSPLFSVLERSYSEQGVELVQYLVEQGADINSIAPNRRTPLFNAIQKGYPSSLIAWMIERGAQVDIYDDWHWSPILVAADHGRLELIPLLHQHGANLNDTTEEDGESILVFAVHNGDMVMVNYLLEHGADPHHKDKFGKTPLEFAVEQNKLEMLSLFEKHALNTALRVSPKALPSKVRL